MKNTKSILATAVILIASSNAALAVDGTATALVLQPITVTESTAMNFGSFAAGTGGTVVLDVADAVSKTGDVTLLSASTTTSADFAISGDGNSAISVAIDAAGAKLGDGLADTMLISAITNTALPTALVAGTASLTVGATLTVASGQTPGAYSTATGGTPYTVTVNYN